MFPRLPPHAREGGGPIDDGAPPEMAGASVLLKKFGSPRYESDMFVMPCDSVGSGIFALRSSSALIATPPDAAGRARVARPGDGRASFLASLEAFASAASAAAAASAALPLAPAFARRGRPPSEVVGSVAAPGSFESSGPFSGLASGSPSPRRSVLSWDASAALKNSAPGPAAAPAAAAANASATMTQTVFAPAPATASHLRISVLRSAPWQCVQYLVCISQVSNSLLWSRSMGGSSAPSGPAHGTGPCFPNHW
mmetsp:Transcript_5085/g.20427  ORF Transcript_5085/g.20427 Transcript_5085/m.20427 type:complete len:254 (-) Transcript_5085:4724-5485(-)